MGDIYNEFEVGDIVQVVETPYDECPFSWVGEMSSFLGKTVVISDKTWYKEYNTYGYTIEGDVYSFNWCGNCFVPNGPDFEIEDSSAVCELLGI